MMFESLRLSPRATLLSAVPSPRPYQQATQIRGIWTTASARRWMGCWDLVRRCIPIFRAPTDDGTLLLAMRWSESLIDCASAPPTPPTRYSC
ncbi:hypothetical protein BC834DRAFT_67338 [Gloeopeniophorella convolvens]|nr:hypothetical protein BC834DRAFT_67338 [Gloeopeniophorella convolvens]